MSVETVVLDPASLLVNRKAKQRKTDRIDAKKMVRALLAHDRGDAAVLSRVRVPSVEEEDRKRLLRERRRLVKERTSLTNSIKGLLKLHGVFDLEPHAKGFEAKFAEVRTAYGSPFPPLARQEILRLAERLALVERQIAQVEAARDKAMWSGAKLSIADVPEGSVAHPRNVAPAVSGIGVRITQAAGSGRIKGGYAYCRATDARRRSEPGTTNHRAGNPGRPTYADAIVQFTT